MSQPSPSSPALIDTHCHLDFDYSPKTADDLVREAGEAGVSHLVTIGTEMASLPKVQAISERFENVFHTVGVHPHDAKDVRDDDLDTLAQAASHPKCRAIGEIGADYHYDNSPRDVQIARLNDQLEVALRAGLPVVIHARDAEPDLVQALGAYAARVPTGRTPGVIHCFTGTTPFGQACIEMGFYISLSGILTFKKSQDLQESARAFPLDRLLVETDSPFLAPVPLRGKKCEPAMVRHTAAKLAELKGVSFEEVAAVTTGNAKKVFGIA